VLAPHAEQLKPPRPVYPASHGVSWPRACRRRSRKKEQASARAARGIMPLVSNITEAATVLKWGVWHDGLRAPEFGARRASRCELYSLNSVEETQKELFGPRANRSNVTLCGPRANRSNVTHYSN
jgi:hypothetical protein